MNFSDECEECKRLAKSYEAATMGWFRAQTQLKIACYSTSDPAATDKLVEAMTRIAGRREQLRSESEAHIAAKHPRVASACSSSVS